MILGYVEALNIQNVRQSELLDDVIFMGFEIENQKFIIEVNNYVDEILARLNEAPSIRLYWLFIPHE